VEKLRKESIVEGGSEKEKDNDIILVQQQNITEQDSMLVDDNPSTTVALAVGGSDLSPDADGKGMSRRLQDEWKKM
jgi:hypothetical protein